LIAIPNLPYFPKINPPEKVSKHLSVLLMVLNNSQRNLLSYSLKPTSPIIFSPRNIAGAITKNGVLNAIKWVLKISYKR